MSEKPEALAERLAAGRLAMVEQLTDEVDTLRRENERLNAVALQAQNAAIDLTKKNERLREALSSIAKIDLRGVSLLAAESVLLKVVDKAKAALRREPGDG